MAANRKKAEFRFFQIPNEEDVLALLGSNWIRVYGYDDSGKPIPGLHFHNLMEIGICRWGEGTIVLEQESIPYKEGTLTVIPRDCPHSTVNEQGEKSFWEYIYVNPAEFLQMQYGYGKREMKRFLHRIEQGAIVVQKEQMPLFAQELDCLMHQIRLKEYGYRNCAKGLLFTLLMEIVKFHSEKFIHMENQQTTDIEKVGKMELALAFVEEHYSEDIKVADIAEAAFVSESFLRRIFAQNYSMSPAQYLNFVRIDAVCGLLRKKDLNINEVAQKVGMGNLSTFISNFKKIVGKTPKQWMKDGSVVDEMPMEYRRIAQKYNE